MEKKTNHRIIIIVAIGLLNPLSSFADTLSGYWERYHVKSTNICKEVLRNTIGILTINSGVKKGSELKIYSKSKEDFIYERILKVRKTIPVSNFGYYDSDYVSYPVDTTRIDIENYRYPIINDSHYPFMNIMYDPIKKLKAWVNLEEVQKDFYIDIIKLDSIPIPTPFFVDIFCLTQEGKRKIYKGSKEDSNFYYIFEDQHREFRIIEQKGDFIRLEELIHFEPNEPPEETFESIGWIKIRDSDGLLTIWIRLVDLW